MKRTILTLLAGLLFAFSATSQEMFAGVKAGYGQYEMKALKGFQKSVADKTLNIPAKSLEQIPGYFFQALSMEFKVDTFQFIGMDFTYQTTGGRNALSDYSGSYRLDMNLVGRRLGIFYKDKIGGNTKTGVSVEFKAGAIFTRLTIEEEITIYPKYEEMWDLEFNSLAAFIEPSVVTYRKLSERFRLEIALGYEYELGGVLYLKSSQRENKLNNPETRDTVTANWSGLRLSCGLLYSLNYRNKQ